MDAGTAFSKLDVTNESQTAPETRVDCPFKVGIGGDPNPFLGRVESH